MDSLAAWAGWLFREERSEQRSAVRSGTLRVELPGSVWVLDDHGRTIFARCTPQPPSASLLVCLRLPRLRQA